MSMTLQQVLGEQNTFHQARSGQKRGYTVYTPVGTEPDLFLATEFRDTISGGVTHKCIVTQRLVRTRAGSYIDRSSAQLSWPDGEWGSEDNGQGYTYRNSGGTQRRMVVAVPANTTSLWMCGYPVSAALADVTLSGSGTVVKPSVNFSNTTGDFGVGTPKTPMYCKVAINCGGDTVTVTPHTTASIRIQGFIAVIDDTIGQPDTGVIDPGSFVDVQCTAQTQVAPGPMIIKIAAGADIFWGEGEHWDASGRTITSPVEATYIDNAAWSPAADTFVRLIGKGFRRELAGVISVNLTTGVNVGLYKSVYALTPSGCGITLCHDWNATAAAIAVTLNGGYCGQWGIDPNWQLARNTAYSKAWTPVVGPWGVDTGYCEAVGDVFEMKRNRYIARLTSGCSYAGGVSKIIAKASGDFPKIYHCCLPAGAVVTIAADMKTIFWQLRQVVPFELNEYQLEV